MKDADPRFQRSLEGLSQAIWELAATTPLSELSITVVAQRAGVSRPTFYQHAGDVRELARSVGLRRLEAETPGLPYYGPFGLAEVDAVSQHLALSIRQPMRFLAVYQDFYLNLLEHAATPSLFARVIDLLMARLDMRTFAPLSLVSGISEDRFGTVVHGGIMWRIISWLQSRPAPVEAEDFSLEIGRIFAALVACNTKASR